MEPVPSSLPNVIPFPTAPTVGGIPLLNVVTNITSSIDHAVTVRSVLRDRCHARDAHVDLVRAHLDGRDEMNARAHTSAQRVFDLAADVASRGNVDAAIQILDRGVNILSEDAKSRSSILFSGEWPEGRGSVIIDADFEESR